MMLSKCIYLTFRGLLFLTQRCKLEVNYMGVPLHAAPTNNELGSSSRRRPIKGNN